MELTALRVLRVLVEPVLAAHRLELDSLEVVPGGGRRVLRVTVDGDGPKGRGPLLDDVSAASQSISQALDSCDLTGSAPYLLEVTSRGVSAPLTKPQHWRRNRGRLVEVRLVDGSRRTERIRGADEEQALLDSGPVRYAEVQRATIQVEFNRPADPDLDEPDEQE